MSRIHPSFAKEITEREFAENFANRLRDERDARLMAERAAELEREPVSPPFWHRLVDQAKRRRVGVLATALTGAALILLGLARHGWTAVALTWGGAILLALALNAGARRNP